MKQVGEGAWLLTWDDADELLANRRARRAWTELDERRPDGLIDAVPAARSLLVTGSRAFDPRVLEGLADLEPADETRAPLVHEMGFDLHAGADLAEVLERTGLTEAALAGLLAGTLFTVGFLGFLPGFAYLYGLPERLHLPRRASPRPVVPAGSLAIAGRYAAIYPAASPGGWHLLGATLPPAPLFDPAKDPPGLLMPGDAVRFVVASR